MRDESPLNTKHLVLYTSSPGNESLKCSNWERESVAKEMIRVRRPKFSRWIRAELLEMTGAKRFSLRKFSAAAQKRNASPELRAAVVLYAHENDCIQKLRELAVGNELLDEIHEVEKHLGSRTVERLALRDTPMMSLPPAYRDLMARYNLAYHTPENVAQEKRELREQTREAVLKANVSPSELANSLGLDVANMTAYLTRGETHRFSLETARRIAKSV